MLISLEPLTAAALVPESVVLPRPYRRIDMTM